MTYIDFIEYIRSRAEKAAGKGGITYINHIIKNNDKELDGLVMLEKDHNVAPAIYLNDCYDRYLKGTSIDEIMTDILSKYYRSKDSLELDHANFSSFEKIKDKIVYKIINKEKNQKLLKEIPHETILDLAIVYYCIVARFEDRCATALIYNKRLKMWNISDSDLALAASENTPRLLRSQIRPINDIIAEISTSKQEASICDDIPLAENPMYVLTNESQFNGAACILYENLLYDFASSIGSDLYILPSSVHEVILIPKNEFPDKDNLSCMVKDINESEVAADEVLSDHVYEYRYDRKTIIM